jgi:hypothetical protein
VAKGLLLLLLVAADALPVITYPTSFLQQLLWDNFLHPKFGAFLPSFPELKAKSLACTESEPANKIGVVLLLSRLPIIFLFAHFSFSSPFSPSLTAFAVQEHKIPVGR